MHGVVHNARGTSGAGHPVSLDLLTRAFGSMPATPERNARKVGNRVVQTEDWVIVPLHGMVRVMHPHAIAGGSATTGQLFPPASHCCCGRMQLQLELQ